MLNRVGYSSDISHGVLVEMAENRMELEKKTKPILDTLRSYQDLPPVIFPFQLMVFHFRAESLADHESSIYFVFMQDKALAALAIEDKKRQYTAAEKYLEDVLQSAFAPSE